MPRLLVLGLVLAAFLLSLAGCGGGADAPVTLKNPNTNPKHRGGD